MNLDELIPDDVEIAKMEFVRLGEVGTSVVHGCYTACKLCTGKDLKAALRAEINQAIFNAIKDGVTVGDIKRFTQ